ncbi:very-long-chain 3-oxoacyl-CoA reductase 1-like [Camellia sinensis]|nr:very-long-chain 3-oxoacyl-CoA reductase 1-like [Camellia sinensis]
MEFQAVILISVATLGFISLCSSIINLVKWVYIMFLRPPKNLKRSYGSWAVITGSTDGIGKAIAMELASEGLNLVLVGRDSLKLESTSSEIRYRIGDRVSIRTIVIDFAKVGGEEIEKRIGEEIEGLDVGVLINNAGLAYPFARFFHEVDLNLMESVVGVNIVGATWVTKAVLAGMLKKKKGAIVNIGSGSSGAAVSSYPLYTIYAATKAYIELFSRCISLEYKQHGIDVQCQIPLLVATKMTSIKRTSFFIPSPETYSKASLRAIGYEQISIPYWPHSLQCCLIRALPDVVQDYCLLRYFLGMRKRGLKKQQQEQQQKK